MCVFGLNTSAIVAKECARVCVSCLRHCLSCVIVCRIVVTAKAMPQCVVRPCGDSCGLPRLLDAAIESVAAQWPNRSLTLAVREKPFDQIVGHAHPTHRCIVAAVLGSQRLHVDFFPLEIDAAPVQAPDFRLWPTVRIPGLPRFTLDLLSSDIGICRTYLRFTANLNRTPNSRR